MQGLHAAPAIEAQDARGQLQKLSQDVVRAYQEGRYQEAIVVAERAYQFAGTLLAHATPTRSPA